MFKKNVVVNVVVIAVTTLGNVLINHKTPHYHDKSILLANRDS